MDVEIVAGRGGQNVMVCGGVRHLIADRRGSVHEAVDIGRSGILKNLLDAARELIGGLCPIVILHRNDEDGLGVSGPGTAETGKPEEEGADANQRAHTSRVLHFAILKNLGLRTVTSAGTGPPALRQQHSNQASPW